MGRGSAPPAARPRGGTCARVPPPRVMRWSADVLAMRLPGRCRPRGVCASVSPVRPMRGAAPRAGGGATILLCGAAARGGRRSKREEILRLRRLHAGWRVGPAPYFKTINGNCASPQASSFGAADGGFPPVLHVSIGRAPLPASRSSPNAQSSIGSGGRFSGWSASCPARRRNWPGAFPGVTMRRERAPPEAHQPWPVPFRARRTSRLNSTSRLSVEEYGDGR